MKISRSKVICIIILFVLLIAVIVSTMIVKGKQDDLKNMYALEVIEQDNVQVNVEQDLVEEEQEELPVIVYDNLTMEELSNKLDRSLKNELSGYGSFIANKAIDLGIDPYLATAIMLHETGCTWKCSNLVKSCNNVGGMKGYGCGGYGYFNTLEEGIERFINNIYNNYYLYGLNTAYLMGSKYAEDPEWSIKVDRHIEKIKNR